MLIRTIILLLILTISVAKALAAASDAPVDFARQILPILSNKCFVCHGPDAKDDALVRLDSFSAATSDRGGYRVIDPKNPEASRILVRIHSDDDPMPPAHAEKQLSTDERELLSQWVRQGGTYAKHWAFVPPKKQLPNGIDASQDHVIDDFIGERLDQNKVGFAPQADRRILARRMSLTLTGLPPEPDQLARYLSDDTDRAYERLVDELLASPRYGEHQARY